MGKYYSIALFIINQKIMFMPVKIKYKIRK
jgi:hypothetical protein